MKPKKSEAATPRKNAAPSAAARKLAAPKPSRWPLFAAVAGALLAVFWAYGPAMHGPFLFDDTVLPFALPGFAQPLRAWIGGLRPLLMFTYWVNVQISGSDTFSYHLVNVLIHCAVAALMYFIVRRLLEWGSVEPGMRTPLAGFCGLLFLLHPVESEAVAYLAGRSEALSAMFVFAAFAVFLYRKEASITWARTAAVIVLFLAALASKEHTMVLPALLLLTDYWWNPGFSFRGIRQNWRLYAPLALGAAIGLVRFAPLILNAQTAGFRMKDLTWYQYLFTEFRAIFVYIREFFLPFGLNADWEFPISHSIFDRGAIVGLIALLALIAAAWRFRKRFPLASYGFFAFLVLMAPTSSILPIRDPIAERRLYFASIGLLLVTADLVQRVKLPRPMLTAACAAVLLLFTVVTRARAEAWSSELSLWEDSTAKSPNKPRGHFQLASAYLDAGDCARSVTEFEKTAQYRPDGYSRYNLLVDWGLALNCANQPDQALAKFREAAGLEQTAHVYTQMAKVYGDRAQWTEFEDALNRAQAIDPSFANIYAYRGIEYFKLQRWADAVREYQHALQLDPSLEPTIRQGLTVARQQLARQPAQAAGGR
jgi:tetratricopeptide (TPR) repeat protein